MIMRNYGTWLKLVTFGILLLVVLFSYLLFNFLFDFDPNDYGATIIPLEDIDRETYEDLLDANFLNSGS